MKLRLPFVLMLSAVAANAQGGDWWLFTTTTAAARPSCSMVQSDDALYDALSGAQVSASQLMSFPQIDWSQGRAAVAILPAGSLQLPAPAAASSDLVFRLSPSGGATGGAVVLQAQLQSSGCRVQLSAEAPATGVAGIEVLATLNGTIRAPGLIKTFDPRKMSALEDGAAFLPVAGEFSQATATAQACSDLCARNAACKAVTFEKTKRLCWIKPQVSNTGRSSDMVSAKKLSTVNSMASGGGR
jgi:hypothetical protein